MEPTLLAKAIAATGFMPTEEGLALYATAHRAASKGTIVEIGTWCGKSTLFLASAAKPHGQQVVTIDHHRGSEENQPGWEWHDPTLVDPVTGRIDTLPHLRANLVGAGRDIEATVTIVVGRSTQVARLMRAENIGLVFIDGGHSEAEAQGDYEAWAPLIPTGSYLAVHDVFPDPKDGGQPPWHVVERAVKSGAFEQVAHVGSLRVLERVGPGH